MKRSILIQALALLLTAASCATQVTYYKPQVLESYPHDPEAYTQGLFFHNGQMYESTGQYGSSSMRKIEYETGKVLARRNFGEKYFMEGSVVFRDSLYLLTWLEGMVARLDPQTFETGKVMPYPRQGWGLTTDGRQLIASDGSSKLIFMDGNLDVVRKITVKLNEKSVRNLNELEYIDGRIWANVYLSDLIMIINPKNGVVEGVIDCKGLLPRSERSPQTDVLNGIAMNPETGDIFLTGKNWPKLYRISLNRISSR